ncbi:MAG TPA: cyanophycinase [Bacteroidales bacterium]|nr:cyanophycinase [Bacteroidales bacterium]HRT90141.1 cyanophycinase [Bacteroidales bacterium]
MRILLPLMIILLAGCLPDNRQPHSATHGKLYIIGGGNRPQSMLTEMASLAGISTGKYIYVLPMASSEPDSAILWAKEDFSSAGIKQVYGFNFRKGEEQPPERLDSVRNAGMVYISGGVQSRFMDAVLGTPLYDAVHAAYNNGAVIAGTSAGAAVMSKKMITGEQMKHSGEDAGYTTIEADNIEIKEGLGLIRDVIIDQHFIKRQRLNRLVTGSIENPDEICIGIDESTAIIVEGQSAKVTGSGQVVVIVNRTKNKKVLNGLLGSEGLELSVYLPGDSFAMK